MQKKPFQSKKSLCEALKKVPGLKEPKQDFMRAILAEIILDGPTSKYKISRSLGRSLSRTQELVDYLERKGFVREIVQKKKYRQEKLYDVNLGAFIVIVYPCLGEYIWINGIRRTRFPKIPQHIVERLINEEVILPYEPPKGFEPYSIGIKKGIQKMESSLGTLGKKFVPLYLEYMATPKSDILFGASSTYHILNMWKEEDKEKWRRGCAMFEVIGWLQADSDELTNMASKLIDWQEVGQKALEEICQSRPKTRSEEKQKMRRQPSA